MNLPNFICPGAARSATTALYYLLIQHPQIFLPAIKETRFFTQDFEKGLPWYEQKHYANVKDEIAIGDISPVYLVDDRCPKRIHDALGTDIKLIFMLRNPVERAYSHFCMLQSHNFEELPFEEAIAIDEDDRIEKSLKHYHHKYGFQYLKESSYSHWIQSYLEHFKKEQMKFVIFEEFTTDTKPHLSEILEFLEINGNHVFEYDVYKNPKTVSGSSKINQVFYGNALLKKTRDFIQSKTSWKTQSLLKKLKNKFLSDRNSKNESMNEATRDQLYNYFEDEIRRLEPLIGKDLSLWKRPEA